MAKCAGLTIEFPDAAPIRISGYPDDDPPFVLIAADQPDSELIFAILQKIGLVPVQNAPFHFPWFLNRPYENERVGETAYKTRRTVRQKFKRGWRAGLWTMFVYSQLPCQNEFRDFLKRHPEKMILMPVVWFCILKIRLAKSFLHSH
jgi:hypothetical protein